MYTVKENERTTRKGKASSPETQSLTSERTKEFNKGKVLVYFSFESSKQVNIKAAAETHRWGACSISSAPSFLSVLSGCASWPLSLPHWWACLHSAQSPVSLLPSPLCFPLSWYLFSPQKLSAWSFGIPDRLLESSPPNLRTGQGCTRDLECRPPASTPGRIHLCEQVQVFPRLWQDAQGLPVILHCCRPVVLGVSPASRFGGAGPRCPLSDPSLPGWYWIQEPASGKRNWTSSKGWRCFNQDLVWTRSHNHAAPSVKTWPPSFLSSYPLKINHEIGSKWWRKPAFSGQLSWLSCTSTLLLFLWG